MKTKSALILVMGAMLLAAASFSSAFQGQVQSPDLAGKWDILPSDNRLAAGATVEFILKDARWEGKFNAPSGQTFSLNTVTLEENRLLFSFQTVAGEPDSAWTYSAKIAEDRMEGVARFGSLDDAPFTAKKRKA
jgi:hypothetical protein